jgi:transaldolase
MKFFLDTANLDLIAYYHNLGVIDGVTTNPALIAKEGIHKSNIAYHISQIVEILQGPISVEVYALTAEEMVKEGLEYRAISDQIVVKVPATEEGLKACKLLSSQHIPVNVTLIFTPLQALIAAKNGATYVSPFIGRLEDAQIDGVQLIQDIRTILDNYDFKTNILASSFRTTNELKQAAIIGSDYATVSPDILKKVFSNPFTEKGLKDFLDVAI